MSRWLLAAVVLGCWGCAFSLDGPDPQRPRNRVPRCDTSKGLVALDGVMATAFGVTTLAVAAEGEPAAALIPLGIGALYLGGAVAGNRSVDACRKALEEYDQSYDAERYAISDDEDDDEDGEGRRRTKPLIPRGQPAGQAAQPPPYQTPYPPPGYPNAPAPTGYPQQPTPAQPFPAQPPAAPVTQPLSPPPQSQPQPQPPPPRQPKQQRPAPPPPPASGDGDWSDFWREVP